MTTLGERLPEAIRIGAEDYPVRWDWRSCMRIILAFESDELTGCEKLGLMTELLYKNRPPTSGEVCEKAIRFLNCGEVEGGGSGEVAHRLYSFERDAALIYAAFRQSHGLDLNREELHWWEFCSLFMSLREDCLFCRVVSLRERKRRGVLTPEERRQTAGMERLLELPERYSPEEERQMARFLETLR